MTVAAGAVVVVAATAEAAAVGFVAGFAVEVVEDLRWTGKYFPGVRTQATAAKVQRDVTENC